MVPRLRVGVTLTLPSALPHSRLIGAIASPCWRYVVSNGFTLCIQLVLLFASSLLFLSPSLS